MSCVFGLAFGLSNKYYLAVRIFGIHITFDNLFPIREVEMRDQRSGSFTINAVGASPEEPPKAEGGSGLTSEAQRASEQGIIHGALGRLANLDVQIVWTDDQTRFSDERSTQILPISSLHHRVHLVPSCPPHTLLRPCHRGPVLLRGSPHHNPIGRKADFRMASFVPATSIEVWRHTSC